MLESRGVELGICRAIAREEGGAEVGEGVSQ